MEIRANRLLFFLIILSFFSCKKEEVPESITGDVIFQLTGKVANEDFHLQAGVDDYYMFSDYTNKTDNSAFGNYSGLLSSRNINQNKEGIEIIISNELPGISSASKLEDLISKVNLNYSLQGESVTYYEGIFQSETNKNVKAYLWEFGDGTTSTLANPSHQYTNIGIEKYSVCLTVTFDDNCSDQICSDVFMPHSACGAKIKISQLPDSTGTRLIFSAPDKGQGPFNYSWNIENSTYADSVVNHLYSRNTFMDTSDNVSVSIIDANNCKSILRRNVNPFNINNLCMVNFDYNGFALISGENNIPDALVTINYTSKDGTFYSSSLNTQSSESFFSILSSADYKINEDGNQTKSLDLSFTCDVFDPDGNLMILKDVTGKIAVAHP